MSHHVYFAFSSGLSRTQRVPKGTLRRILDHIKTTEETLGLQRTPNYTPEDKEPRPGWYWRDPAADMLTTAGPKTDTTLPQWWLLDRERDNRLAAMGRAVRDHNAFVRALYDDLGKWPKRTWKRGESERITPAQADEFWGGLRILDLPRPLWDREHFGAHMEHLHELLTKGSSEGVLLDCKPFTPKQASALILLLEGEIDQWGFDARFAIPLDARLKPCDFIAASDDGGYDWCSHCGPIHTDAFHARCRVCPRAKKGQCDLKNSHPAEFED